MTIPLTPFPSLSQIFYAGSKEKTPWNTFDRQISFFVRGGVALAAALKLLRKERKQSDIVVYIPDYFCNQSLIWLRNEKCKIKFYPVGLSLKPDWEKVDHMAKTDIPPDLFVIVHYFGFCNDIDQTVKFCKKYGSRLVEDAAHVLHPTEQIGRNSWISLFSPHKLLPLPPLGVLTFNGNEDNTFNSPDSQPLFLSTDISWLFKRTLQKFLTRIKIDYMSVQSLPDFEDFDDGKIDELFFPHDSYVSKVVIQWFYGLIDRLQDISMKRQSNYQKLTNVLLEKPNVRVVFDCEDNKSTPYLFAFQMEEANKTFEVFKALRLQNVPVQTWPDIPPEVLARPAYHSNALKLRHTILTLPVHQNLNDKQVLDMANALKFIGRAKISCN